MIQISVRFFRGIIDTRTRMYTGSTSFLFLYAISISNKFIMMIYEWVSHDLALSNSTMKSFQPIQESWHYYIDVIYFFGTFQRQD